MAGERSAEALVSASSIRPSRVHWLYHGWIPLGGISLLAGTPGIGKSLWTVQLAARLSRGELTDRPARSLIVTAEDSLSAVVVPRLRAAGADLDLVKLPPGEAALWLPNAADTIERWVMDEQLRLVIFDPLTAFLPDRRVDTWRDSSVRGALAPLAAIADRHRIAVLAIVHLNKGGTSDPIRRVGGSVGFPAAARSVLLLAANPDYPGSDRRVLAHVKSNFGRLSESLALVIREGDGDEPSQIIEIGTSPHSATDLLGEPETASRLEEAMDFLLSELAAGPRRVSDLTASASAAGISGITLRRAQRRLGVTSIKVGFEGWAWTLPEPGTTAADDDLAA